MRGCLDIKSRLSTQMVAHAGLCGFQSLLATSCCLWWGRTVNRPSQHNRLKTRDLVSARQALQLHYEACTVDHDVAGHLLLMLVSHSICNKPSQLLNQDCTQDAPNLRLDKVPVRQLSCKLRQQMCGLPYQSLGLHH